MEEEIIKQYNYDEESYYVVTVKSIKFNSILDVNDPIVKTDVKAMRMRQLGTDILDYDYVKEFKDFLQTDQEFGTCVIDNLVGMYEKTLKITRDQLINIIKKYYSDQRTSLDFDVDEWKLQDGVDPMCLQHFAKCLILVIMPMMWLIIAF